MGGAFDAVFANVKYIESQIRKPVSFFLYSQFRFVTTHYNAGFILLRCVIFEPFVDGRVSSFSNRLDDVNIFNVELNIVVENVGHGDRRQNK